MLLKLKKEALKRAFILHNVKCVKVYSKWFSISKDFLKTSFLVIKEIVKNIFVTLCFFQISVEIITYREYYIPYSLLSTFVPCCTCRLILSVQPLLLLLLRYRQIHACKINSNNLELELKGLCSTAEIKEHIYGCWVQWFSASYATVKKCMK